MSIAIVVAELLVVAVLALAWPESWQWLTACHRGPIKGDANGCSYANGLVLLVLPSLPWIVAAWRWDRS